MEIIKINNPKEYFTGKNLEQVCEAVKNGFDSPMTDEDIYNHLVKPESTSVFISDNKIIGMASTSIVNVFGIPTTYLEGIAINQEHQKKGLGKMFLEDVDTPFIAGRTQNPNAYKCIKNACSSIVPMVYRNSQRETLKLRRDEFARIMDFKIDDLGVIRGCYGKSLYSEIPKSSDSSLFDYTLNLNYSEGDSVVFMGKLK